MFLGADHLVASLLPPTLFVVVHARMLLWQPVLLAERVAWTSHQHPQVSTSMTDLHRPRYDCIRDLIHHRTRASYVYNGCLAWYNVVSYNCLEWYKFVNTHLYHSRQLYNIHETDKKISQRQWRRNVVSFGPET